MTERECSKKLSSCVGEFTCYFIVSQLAMMYYGNADEYTDRGYDKSANLHLQIARELSDCARKIRKISLDY